MRLSFRLKTILGVAAIEAVLLTALVVSGVGFLSSSAEAEFERRTQATVKAFSVVAKEALISSDLAALNALAREMLTYPGVVYARVRDADHQVIARAGDAAQLDKSVAENPTLASVTDGVLRTGVDIQVGSQRFGRVEIGVSAGEVQSVQATAQRYGLGLAALEMLLVALFSWALGAYLTRQLARLSQAAKRIAGGELGYQMPVQGGDELAETATAFNRMSLQLADSYAALHHNEQDLRLRGHILGAIGVGIVIADARTPDQSVVYVNQAFERITGWLSQDVLGRNCRFLQGPHTDPAELRRLRDAIAEGRDVDVLLLNYTRQGRPFWNELHVMPVRNHAGELTHFVALQTDVSSRIEAQQAITRSEEQLRRVLNATHDGIIVIDDRGAIVSFNAGAERLFGYTVEEVHGRNISMIVPEPHRAHHDAYLQRYLATGESRIMGLEREFEAQRKDGVSIWIALRVGVLEGEPGTPASRDGRRRFIGVVHDITERKRGEVELRHAKEAAEDAAIAKSEFLASMSHEIRTPMHGVLGSIEMLQDTALTGQQQRYLETARTSAGMLLGVIDEILDFSRLEAGKLRIEALDFDPRRTVEDVTAMLAQRAHSKKLELACYIAPEVPELMRGDPIRLRQVLVNLVGNAIKFTERGEVVVSVSAVPGLGSERVLRIEVRDTGIGIARDKQATLFQPFTQADSSMSRRFGGSGLGLSIAKRLVELMQGSIGFESVAEQGSRFWFTLPLQRATAGSRDARSRVFAGTRVLVVDDNATNRIILHRYLTAWGSQSSSAANGEEALAKLQDAATSGRPYEIALLDLNMPGMDGYTLVQQIRQDPALAAMPLIMLSSSVQDTERIEGLGVDVWLDKPLRQSDLHDAIATVLHQRAPVPAPLAVPNGTTLQFAGERVLLVEDNPVTQDVGMQMLRKRGLDVEVADDGRQAVDRVRQQDFDLVLMDIQMPGMDGYAATRAIRAWEAENGRPRMPIVALTAHALPADRDRCLAAGMDDYIVKPYSAQALATMVARWLMPPGVVAAAHVDTAPAPLGPLADPVIDTARYAQVLAVMGAAMGPLLDKVIETMDSEIRQILAAAGAAEMGTLRELMHRLKNTAGDIGATQVYALAATTERRLIDAPAATPDLGALDAACRAALEAIQRLRADLPPVNSPNGPDGP